jgi:hypothetical protein
MSTKLHVANLSPGVTNPDLAQLFAAHGPVLEARVTTFRDSERSTGSAIVDMASEAAGDAAIEALDGRDLGGRPMAVAPATPRDEADAAGTSLFGPMNMMAEDEVARREPPAPGPAPAPASPPLEGWAPGAQLPVVDVVGDDDALAYLVDGNYLMRRAGGHYIGAGGRVSPKFIRGLIDAGHVNDDAFPVQLNEKGRRELRRGRPRGPHWLAQ